RRTIFMGLIVGAPVLIALFLRMLDALGAPVFRVQGATMAGPTIFGLMIWVFYLRFTVPVLGVFYGTSLIADEVEDKTITYLFTRPVRRGAVVVGKYIAYLLCTSLVVLPSVMVVYFLMVPFSQIPGTFISLLIDLGVLGLGLAAYGALFAFIGAALKRPLVVGLVFIFGWELVTLFIPGYLKRFTLAYYLQPLVPHSMPAGDTVSLLQGAVFREPPSVAASLSWLAVAIIVSLVLAVRVVEQREYILEQ
ncbi:MAG TPA: ABC transporter permease subunit, partial [Vicinamibacterales bacterium]|nr:ABC transporter permease subunit [Vicinamibacterales bacterium]